MGNTNIAQTCFLCDRERHMEKKPDHCMVNSYVKNAMMVLLVEGKLPSWLTLPCGMAS